MQITQRAEKNKGLQWVGKAETVRGSSSREGRKEAENESSLYSDQWMACPLLCLHFLWLTQ